jgi:acetylornithine deacetylase/succinyl-diaminopimelate desuccinylase-like protein
MPRLRRAAIDWENALWDVVSHLQTLIRIETVNPPGNEIGAARYLDDVLRGAGIATALFEAAPGRASVAARLPARKATAAPILLLAHLDVVGVEREQWKQKPFGGEIVDRVLYGRGAIDDKGMLACNLQAMLLLKRHVVDAGGRLTRDVVFLATADEEAGGTFGVDWLVDNHPEVLEAEYALNEGGRVRVVGGRTLYCAVQCAEKVPHVLVVRATGTSGHASVPLPDNAIARLARALAGMSRHREPLRLTDVSRGFFGELAAVWPDAAEARAMQDLASDDPARVRAGEAVLSAVPSYDAILRNGVSLTMLAGGVRPNVIPAEATATVNVRTLPGERIADVCTRLAAAAGEPGIEIRLRGSGDDAPPSPVRSPMFDAIRDAVRELEPSVAVVPYLSTGATDSATLRRLGVKAYGLLPFPLTQEEEGRMHGHDEGVPIASLGFGVRAVYGTLARMVVG